jgi:hypothetical protein
MAKLKRLHPAWPSWAALVALAVLFVSERLFVGTSTTRLAVGALAGVALLAATVVRWIEQARATGEGRRVRTRLAVATTLLLSSAVAYAATLFVGEASDDHAARWVATGWAVTLIALSLGAFPLLWLEAAVAPVAFNDGYELRRVDHAWRRGWSFGLLVPVLFLINFLAERHDQKIDLALGNVASPSEQTLTAVRETTKDVRVLLFYPRRNEVAQKLERYFEPLVDASPHLTVERVDQAIARDAAEQAKISTNGYVVLMRGDTVEKVRVPEDARSARNALRRFDTDFLKRLLRTTSSDKVAYFTTGHEERAFERADREDPRAPVTFLTRQLENMQYDVRPLGLAEGLQTRVPDDAGIVFVMGPDRELLPAEQASLRSALDRGGRLLVALDAGSEVQLETLLEGTGLAFDPTTLADEQNHVTLTRTRADRTILPTNVYRRHDSLRALARNRNVATLFFGAGSLSESDVPDDSPIRSAVTIESLPTSFVDRDGDLELDDDETTGSRPLVAAVTRTSTTGEEGRMVVISDVDAVADELVQQVQGNVVLLREIFLWLQKEEDPVVTVDTTEDVKIVHRREEDVMVFYGTTFGVPILVLGLGWLVQRRRWMS